jgi:hypothetical protein
MTPKVTVLLAVHNGEPFVRDAVASVLDQTFTDFELLVIDDASEDATADAVASFDDERIRLFRNEQNRGQVPSLNRGLQAARGEYVARLDHDDFCRPTRLERQVEVLDREPDVGLVGTWMELIEEGGRRIGWLRSTIADFAEFFYHTLIMRVYISHPSAMYRREAVLALGGYDEATGPAEDKDLWRRLLLARWDARIVPEPLVVYRLHGQQLSQTQAAYQREVDGESQQRLLGELAPSTPLRALRLALADDPAFWDEQRDVGELLRALAAVLAGARERLRIAEPDAQRLERLLAAWLLRVARRRPWRRDALALAAWALNRVPAERRMAAATAYAAAFPLAPLRLGVARAGRALGSQPVLRGARRSRLARRVYGRLVG